MTQPHRQRYGLGSFIKKVAKKVKKVVKSPLGKAAMLGLGAYGLGGAGFLGGKGIFASGQGLQRFRNLANIGGALRSGLFGKGALPPSQGLGTSSGLWGGLKKFGLGKAALLGLGAAGMAAPFFAGKDDEEEEGPSWDVTPSSIANIRNMARLQDPSLAFLPPEASVQSGYYLAEGGLAGLANGGGAANAQAEQMLKMEYQKYRNQGGTMSYQQFKMAVLQQAQSQGPMAQGQGERPMFQGGELVEDASMVEETPEGMMAENVEEVQGEPTREQLEALAMEIFQLRLEELDEEQLMVVYQAAMEQQPEAMAMQEDIQFDPQMAAPQMAANGGRMGYGLGSFVRSLFGKKEAQAQAAPDTVATKNPNILRQKLLGHFKAKMGGEEDFKDDFRDQWTQPFIQAAQGGRIGLANGGVLGSHVPGYTTPPGYNQFDYPSGGLRVGRAEGGLMDLGGMEKDYRQEGGFVPLGGKEKADDVPARLSKNEFVFTADAVRNAGGGDIDSGAEVMQNVMDNLEQGGQISEDSQGLGGEEMISEEELIEAPNGAQEMYDQQAMLESRMA